MFQALLSKRLSSRDKYGLCGAIRLDSLKSMLGPDATLLSAPKGNIRLELEMGVDPDRPCFEFPGEPLRLLQVSGPNRSAETHGTIVGTPEDILFVLPLEYWEDGT